MAKPKDDPQMSFTEREVEDPDFLDLIVEYMDAAPDSAERRRFNRAKKKLNDYIDKLDELEDGLVLRCSKYAVPIRHRSGGGFEMKAWEKFGAGKVRIGG